MAGYLDQYGAQDERRIRIFKSLAITLVSLVVIAGAAFFIFHNYRQERQVKRFFELLESKDYHAAYQLWVRSEDDRKGYPYESFLQDWGPQGRHNDVSQFRITRSRSCGSGVILSVDFARGEPEKLWVERNELTIGFSPLQGCPAPR